MCAKEYKKSHFSPSFLLYVDSSFNIKDTVLKYSVVVIGLAMEGTVSQIFCLGPSFYFM